MKAQKLTYEEIKQRRKDYLLVFSLLFFSGNPLSGFLFGKFETLVLLVLTLVLLGDKVKRGPVFYSKYSNAVLVLILIFFFQWADLGFLSWLGAFNFLLKIFTGGLIINYLGSRFNEVFFNVLYPLSLVSLIFLVTINIIGVLPPGIAIGGGKLSYVIYCSLPDLDIVRNAGMFWEPGAFGGVLTLCLALNFDNLKVYWEKSRFKLIIVLIALLTTQSTGGYLSFFIILIFYFLNIKNKILVLLVLPVILITAFYTYENTEFLKEKIELQYQNAQNQYVGEVNNDRIGSIIFDWHYIIKHPFIGNGMHEETRFADDPDLRAARESVGSGNGFSGYMASMGIFFILGYFILLYMAFPTNRKQYVALILLIVFLNLQDEQWFDYPLYLGLLFVDFKSNGLMGLKAPFSNKISSNNN